MKFFMRDLVNLLNEVGMLEQTPRSGFAFLGSGQQSVAEHSYRMTFIAYVLSKKSSEPVNLQKLLLMCLLHDLPEARTGDLNYVNKRYVVANEDKVLEDLKKESSLGPEMANLIDEYRQNQTLEAHMAHDADQLELMLVLKREKDLGNEAAQDWLDIVKQRISLPISKKIAEEILVTPSSAWWIREKEDLHWVNGK